VLVQNAEAALKEAKASGEKYLHHRLEMNSELARRVGTEQRLRLALDHDQFVLHYQPKIALRTGLVTGVEALLRWNDPEQGLVAPARFLPLLESSGLIVPVGAWVLQRALHDRARWLGMGLPAVRVAVNVAPMQIGRRGFTHQVLQCLSGTCADSGLDLEITETALMHDLPGISRRLRALRAAGVRIALDDFGTGYSSLGLLSRLPVDVLKIDRRFIRGLPTDPASVTLTRTIVGLASGFGLKTVAEGVESATQLGLVRELGCDYSQGYLHARPQPAPQIERVLARQLQR